MLQLKLSYLAQIIGLGYNVLLSDVDIAYVENPLAYARNVLSSAENGDKYDMLIQSDTRPQVEESANWVCAGNFYLRATNAAAEFVREVSLCMHRTGFPDQDCMQVRKQNQNKETNETHALTVIAFLFVAHFVWQWTRTGVSAAHTISLSSRYGICLCVGRSAALGKRRSLLCSGIQRKVWRGAGVGARQSELG